MHFKLMNAEVSDSYDHHFNGMPIREKSQNDEAFKNICCTIRLTCISYTVPEDFILLSFICYIYITLIFVMIHFHNTDTSGTETSVITILHFFR